MDGISRLLPASDLPSRQVVSLGLILLLACDAALLTLLPEAAFVASIVLAAVAGLLLSVRLAWLLAVMAVGLPLLDPFVVALDLATPAFAFFRFFLLLAVARILLSGSAGTGRRAALLLTDGILWWALALGLVVWAGLLESPSPAYGRAKVLAYFATSLPLLVGGAIAGTRWSDEPSSRDRPVVSFLSAVLVLSALVAIVSLLTHASRAAPSGQRLSALGLNPIWLARNMGLGILAGIGLLGAGKIRPAALVILIVPLGIVMVLSGSRGPLIGLALVLTCWTVFVLPGSRGARLLRLAAAASLALLALLLMPEQIRERFLNPVRIDASGAVRLRLLEIAREAVPHAAGWGTGTGGFSDLMKMGDNRLYPHNLIAEVGIENGLPGLVCLAGFLLAALGRGMRRAGDPMMIALLFSLLFAVWNAQFSGDLMANEWVWLFAGWIAGRSR
ncbi:MAG: hypothetical protein FJY88_04895 [Candidatus Eisenbacteria bacterium]|nr:hypothetical protein [Candidatus Eisenbacteria bacterium]